MTEVICEKKVVHVVLSCLKKKCKTTSIYGEMIIAFYSKFPVKRMTGFCDIDVVMIASQEIH